MLFSGNPAQLTVVKGMMAANNSVTAIDFFITFYLHNPPAKAGCLKRRFHRSFLNLLLLLSVYYVFSKNEWKKA